MYTVQGYWLLAFIVLYMHNNCDISPYDTMTNISPYDTMTNFDLHNCLYIMLF